MKTLRTILLEWINTFRSFFVTVELPYSDVKVEYQPQPDGNFLAIARDTNGEVVSETTIVVSQEPNERPATAAAAAAGH